MAIGPLRYIVAMIVQLLLYMVVKWSAIYGCLKPRTWRSYVQSTARCSSYWPMSLPFCGKSLESLHSHPVRSVLLQVSHYRYTEMIAHQLQWATPNHPLTTVAALSSVPRKTGWEQLTVKIRVPTCNRGTHTRLSHALFFDLIHKHKQRFYYIVKQQSITWLTWQSADNQFDGYTTWHWLLYFIYRSQFSVINSSLSSQDGGCRV